MMVRRLLPAIAFLSAAAWGAVITINPATLPNCPVTGQYPSTTLTATGQAPGAVVTWAAATGLPPGVTFNTATQLVSGTCNTAGPYSFTINATTPTDAGSRTYTVNVIGITSPQVLQPGTIGVVYPTVTLTVAGAVNPVTWTHQTQLLPAGLTLNPNGTVTGTPTGPAGTTSFVAVATDSTNNSTSSTLSITITQVAVTPSTLPGGTVGNQYSVTFGTSPPQSGVTWSLSGTPIPGVSLNAATGAFSGQLTTAGTFAFTIAAMQNAVTLASQQYSVTVGSCAGFTPTLDTTNFNTRAAVGVPFSSTLGAICGVPPYTYVLFGISPANGLTVSSSGVVSGIPVVAGSTTLIITVHDSQNNQGGGGTTINVIGITTSSLPNGSISTPYSQQLMVAGNVGATTWALANATALPPGLALSTTGVISGTPTTNGSYPFSVVVSDGTQNATTANLTIVIGVSGALTITTTSPIAPGVPGTPYSLQLAATGGTLPYTWTAPPGTLPPGLTLSTSGLLSGTPTTAGSNTFTVTVTDSATPTRASVAATLTMAVSNCTSLCITTTSLPQGTVGAAYTPFAVQASSGTPPYTWNASGLPNGLSLTPGGIITGTPTLAGSNQVTITATDSAQLARTATVTLPLTIVSNGLRIITTSPLPPGTISSSYPALQLAVAGGTAPFTWTANGLPPGLSLSSGGVLTGVPTSAGTTSFTVTVTDSTNASTTGTLSVTINALPLTITTTSPVNAGGVGIPYSKTFAAVGGVAPYTWTATSLPAGLTLSSTGMLTGTPTTAGTTTFFVTVTDSLGTSNNATFTMLVSTPTLTVTTTIPASCFVATKGRLFPDPEIPGTNSGGTCPNPGTAQSIYQFTATGGTAPYVFSLAVPGTLPPGMNISSAGVVNGAPTATGSYTFTVVATDSLQAIGSLATTLVVGTVGQPTSVNIILGGSTSGTIPAAQQPPVVLSIGGTPFPYAVSGTLRVDFASSVGGIPTLVTFSNGTPMTTFTIPANTNNAIISNGNVLTGTQAGTITLTVKEFHDRFGNDMTPATPSPVSYTIAAGPPVITNVSVSNIPPPSPSGFTLLITGYSTTRDMTSATFTFTSPSTDTLASSTVTVPLTAAFTTWYSDSRSNPFGSTFVLTIPFTFSSSATVTKPISGVTLTMTNSKGTSNPSNSVNPYP